MKVFVNLDEIRLSPGMTVRHALIGANLLDEVKAGKKTYDEWGNEVGLDGELSEGSKVYVRSPVKGR